MRDQLIRDIQAIEAKYKKEAAAAEINESVDRGWPELALFEEYINEANLPGQPMAQRPIFNGVSPDSVEQLFQKTKEIGNSISEFIRFSQKTQPQLAAALTEFQQYLKASAPIVGKIRAALNTEYSSGPWERQQVGAPSQQQ